MTTGVSFVLWCYARNPQGRVGMIREERVGTGDDFGSKRVSHSWTGDTWPDTRAGWRACEAEVYRRNVEEGVRLGITQRETLEVSA